MAELQRITTEYIDLEDRIRLTGEAGNDAPIVLWLTRRLLQRLLPALLQGLQGKGGDAPHAEILHSFAQQAAQAELTPESPVRPGEGSSAWLVLSVNIALSEESVCMRFCGSDGQHASLKLAGKALRQWLAIVHAAYLNADWPLDLWPQWLRESAEPPVKRAALLH